MTADVPKRLRMFAGPNGSGKTSLARRLGKEFSPNGLIRLYHFVNADDLLRDLQDGRGVSFADLGLAVTIDQLRTALLSGGRLRADHPFLGATRVVDSVLTAPTAACDAYAAAAVADFIRDELLALGRSFSFETVMSHRSKVDFFARARNCGYRTYLYFLATESPQLSVSRVQNRAEIGGHDVPEQKIIERYHRCLGLIRDALAHAHRAFLFDNSGTEPVWLAQLTPEGRLQIQMPPEALPAWFKTWVLPSA